MGVGDGTDLRAHRSGDFAAPFWWNRGSQKSAHLPSPHLMQQQGEEGGRHALQSSPVRTARRLQETHAMHKGMLEVTMICKWSPSGHIQSNCTGIQSKVVCIETSSENKEPPLHQRVACIHAGVGASRLSHCHNAVQNKQRKSTETVCFHNC